MHRRPGRRPQGRREPSAFTATTLSVHFYDSISVFERSRHLTGHALGRGLRQAARRRVEEPDRPAAGAIATVARANGNAGRSGGGGGGALASPRVGDPAPDFTLSGTPGAKPYTLSDLRGRVVVLVFYPGDDTIVCTEQLVNYSTDLAQFGDLGAQVLGISPQDVESHEQFADRHDLGFPLLADRGKEVGRLYELVGPLGFYKRSVFVVDAEGTVRYAHRSRHGLTYRPTSELVAAVREAGAPAG